MSWTDVVETNEMRNEKRCNATGNAMQSYTGLTTFRLRLHCNESTREQGIETVVIPLTSGRMYVFQAKMKMSAPRRDDTAVRFIFLYICMTSIIKLVEIVHQFRFSSVRYIGLLHVKYRISKVSVSWYILIKNISLDNHILQITWVTECDPFGNYINRSFCET